MRERIDVEYMPHEKKTIKGKERTAVRGGLPALGCEKCKNIADIESCRIIENAKFVLRKTWLDPKIEPSKKEKRWNEKKEELVRFFSFCAFCFSTVTCSQRRFLSQFLSQEDRSSSKS